MSTISVDTYYGPELVEFWAHKYKKVKEELEESKRKIEAARQTQLSAEYGELLALVRGLHNGVEESAIVRRKLEIAEREKMELSSRVAKVEAERAVLAQQIQVCVAQAVALAAEADQQRRDALSDLFPPVSFVDAGFEPSPLMFINPTDVVTSLESHFADSSRIYFLPRPPACMPLRVPACGQPGYWFYPNCVSSEDVEFDLVVEGRPGEWSYLGSYTTALFPGAEMKLSEWMNLDEQTKMAHCARLAADNARLPPGQPAPYPDQLAVKRRYELGEWHVPCYHLRCVGFNMPLYEALHAAVTKLASTESSTGGTQSRSPEPRGTAPQTSPGLQLVFSSVEGSGSSTGGGKRRRAGAQRSDMSGAEDPSVDGSKKKPRTYKLGNMIGEPKKTT